MTMRCAVYARISTDKQSSLSPADQIRKCREFADRNGFEVLDQHIYKDEGQSGVGLDRPEFQMMLEAAMSPSKPFDAILVDDTSRLSRSTEHTLAIFNKLNFAGVRLVAVSQGIDSESDQAEILFTFQGVINSQYVKELAKKTHRGLEGRVLRGFCTGGRCFGYGAVSAQEGGLKRRVINPEEAATVKRIFEMSASGISLKSIAKTLNAEAIASPRPRTGRLGSWCQTAVRAMLKRELYKGEEVWNKTRFVKAPGTNKRRSKARPESDWIRIQHPELAIVSSELWDAVQVRLQHYASLCRKQEKPGLAPRSLTSPHLFSGLLKCGICGGNMVIGTGGGTHVHPKYVCTNYINRGLCKNNLYVRRDELEEILLARLQSELFRPEEVENAVQEFGRQLRVSLDDMSSDLAQMRQRKEKLEREIHNFTQAIADGGHSRYLLVEIATREKEISSITDRLLSATGNSMEKHIGKVRQIVEDGIADLRGLLSEKSASAKAELHRHLKEIRMFPSQDENGWYYEVDGSWDLLGAGSGLDQRRQYDDWRLRMVAGVRFELTTFGL